jgi:hypothetical protein
MSGFRVWIMMLACLLDFATGRHRRWVLQVQRAKVLRRP